MKKPHPVPMDESFRQAVLDRLAIMDTDAEESYDRITSLAASFFAVPMCLVSLIDRDRQWFKSRFGLDVVQTPRDETFCAHAIMRDDLMIVEDAHNDPRFAAAPLVLGPPYIRFYAGAPLIMRGGARVGTLCLIDQVPEPGFDHEMKLKLRQFADIVQDQLQARLDANERAESLERVGSESRLAKARFLQLVSHELRTPLNAVIGFADLMSMKIEHGQSVDVESYAEMISSGARTLLSHVEQLLSITNLERGDLQMNESVVMLDQVLDASLRQLMAEATLCNHVIEQADVSAANLSMKADGGFVRQIIMHMLSHAIAKATTGAVINVSVERRELDAAINVDFETTTDITETTKALRDPFEIAVDPMFANDEGLGVVLYIARLLTEAHGGTVNAIQTTDGTTRLSAAFPGYRVLSGKLAAARA